MHGYEQFQTLVKTMPMVFYILDEDWQFTLSDGQGLQKLGLVPGQVVGLSARVMYQDFPDIIEAIERAYTGEFVTKEHQLGDLWLENHVVPLYSSEGDICGVVGSTIDITERKKAEASLRASAQFTTALIDSLPGILFMYDDLGRLVYWNKAHEVITGYNAQELFHMSLMDWYPNDIESQEAIANGLSATAANGFGQAEAKLRTKDGKLIPMYFTACPLVVNDISCFIGIGIDITARLAAEEKLKELNATLEYKVAKRTAQLASANAELIAANEELAAMNDQVQSVNLELISMNEEVQSVNLELTAMNEEITAMNEELYDTNDRLISMQAQLVESEKMAALGNLVAGVAHEINTPLGVGVTASSHMRALIDELLHSLKDKTLTQQGLTSFLEDIDEASHIILSNLERASRLVQSFKQLSTDQTSEQRRKFNVEAYINEVLLSLTPTLKNKPLTIQIHCPKDLKMDSYPGALSQIISNLIINSIHHGFNPMQEGLLTIDITPTPTGIQLIYSDNGNGMDAHVLAHIFDPFFTTKRGKGGTGLGLSVVFGLVTHQFHGSIKCDSSPGNGTTFTMQLKNEDNA